MQAAYKHVYTLPNTYYATHTFNPLPTIHFLEMFIIFSLIT